RHSPDLLDIGTGGGEWLSALTHRPGRTVAVEGWPPNVPVARARLEPLGIEVFEVDPAPPNVAQDAAAAGGALPFPDGAFHLIVSRHEAYLPGEVLHVLAPDGWFLTQQVGSGAGDGYYRLLDEAPPTEPPWDLYVAAMQLNAAGFVVDEADQGFETISFADVGALAWYLKNLPFVYPGFSIAAARDRLRRLHESREAISVRQPLFRIGARRRG
ncbi:MAG TPA: methyltransferase domain-containing protein, partial [Phenylobacterium sp.]